MTSSCFSAVTLVTGSHNEDQAYTIASIAFRKRFSSVCDPHRWFFRGILFCCQYPQSVSSHWICGSARLAIWELPCPPCSFRELSRTHKPTSSGENWVQLRVLWNSSLKSNNSNKNDKLWKLRGADVLRGKETVIGSLSQLNNSREKFLAGFLF